MRRVLFAGLLFVNGVLPFLVTLLLLVAAAVGQELELDAPSEVTPGTLVVLDSEAIPSSGRNWKAVNAPEDSYIVVDEGRRLVFSTARPGRYWFVFTFTEDISEQISELSTAQDGLSAASETAEVEAAKLALATITKRIVELKIQPQSIVHELVVQGDVPLPDPDVPTPPTPRPLPDGKYKLAKLSRDLAMRELTAESRQRAADVAGAHRAVSAQIAAGALKGQESILRALSTKLRDTLGEDFDVWKKWGQATMQAMSELSEKGELKTDDDFAVAFAELALGLEVLK